LNIKQIKGCVVAITENDTAFKNSVFANHDKLLATAIGGKERLHSVHFLMLWIIQQNDTFGAFVPAKALTYPRCFPRYFREIF
jgi:2-C-methyl-D-erythritol 4-phosphate cytidylyltransferase